MKRKILQALVDRLVLKTMADQSPKAQISGGEAAFHQGNFVINWQHDPRDRVAGDVSHQRDDRISCGSIEQF
jgi:hypothetical protein